jgi:hypothetical protein
MTTRTLGAAGLLALAFALAPAAADDPTDPGAGKWTSLFNGKDLTGWKTHPADKAKWEVKDGMLVGTGPVGHLFSERGDYKNCLYRVEAKINDHGNSGQYFRAQFGPGFPKGYEAQINATHRDPIRSGSLYPSFNPKLSPEEREQIIVRKPLTKPDEFFVQEVVAVGNHFVIRVNGETTVNFVDANNTFPQGHFAIQQHDPGTVITVKRVEVIELPDTRGE